MTAHPAPEPDPTERQAKRHVITTRSVGNDTVALDGDPTERQAEDLALHLNRDLMDALSEYGQTYATRDGETELDVLAALERAVAAAGYTKAAPLPATDK